MCGPHDGSLIMIITLIFIRAPCHQFQYRYEVYKQSEKLRVLSTLRRLRVFAYTCAPDSMVSTAGREGASVQHMHP